MKEVTWMKQGLFNAGTPEATEGERSEPKEAGGVLGAPDPEVPEKATRRKFSAEYKLRILQLADSCSDAGSLGRLLRKEGLYSSHLTTWRRMMQGSFNEKGDRWVERILSLRETCRLRDLPTYPSLV